MSIKESKFDGKNWSKFSNLLTVRAEVADPAPTYGQPDRRIFVFLRLPLWNRRIFGSMGNWPISPLASVKKITKMAGEPQSSYFDIPDPSSQPTHISNIYNCRIL